MGNQAVNASSGIRFIPVECVRPNPYQPRKFFERASLEELAASIKEHGVLQPISVRLINGRSFELVAGERRLRACKMAGMTSIPAILVDLTDQESAIVAMIENLQRQNLNFLEEAEGFRNLMADYGITQEQLARRLGKSQSAIANKLRILRLPMSVMQIILENSLTERHARALLRLNTEKEQAAALQKIVSGGLTVSKTETLVERMLGGAAIRQPNAPPVKVRRFVRDVQIFINTVKRAVDIMQSAGVNTEFTVENSPDGCDMRIRVVL